MVLPLKKRILYVDDSQDNRDLLDFVLTDAGYEIETANTVAEGFQAAEMGEFKLYLIDLTLPDGTGFELITRIRVFDPLTPIVVCSGDIRESVQDEILRLGAQAFLKKPIDLDLLTTTLLEILGEI